MAFDQLETEAFWRDLMPDLAVRPAEDHPTAVLSPNEATGRAILGILDREGYIQLPRSQDVALLATLADLIARIRTAGLPPVFAFIYDQMWQPYRRLGPMIDCVLRGPHVLMPNIWAWHVDPRKDEAGWEPHRDRAARAAYADRRPKAVTIWIPLTEATTLNGCMYVVPKHRDGLYGAAASEGFSCELSDIRALPAVPGDSLIWTQDLLHWGSRSSEMAKAPRLSMSVEFQREDEPPLSDFVIQASRPLNFEQKLALIGRAIVNYQHMHPLESDLTDAARRWRERIPVLFGVSGARFGTPAAKAEDLLSRP